MFFLIYFFGFSNSFAFGEKYVTAITFATMVTDVQWDISNAIKTVAKIDIVKHKFDYGEHLKNAFKLIFILISSVIILTVSFYFVFRPNLGIAMIFIGWHIIDFATCPLVLSKSCFCELEWSASKTVTHIMIAYGIRTLISFLPTPYCTIIGQMVASVYELICFAIIGLKIDFKNLWKQKLAPADDKTLLEEKHEENFS